MLDELNRQYRQQRKTRAVWFLPLDTRISPHSDDLLGPLKKDKKGNAESAKDSE